jgi:uncharacterized membrane protein
MLKNVISAILIIVILGSVGFLVYLVNQPGVGNTFTEFYLLGNNGAAADYPNTFTLGTNNQVTTVQYDSDSTPISENYGLITLVVINHEQQTMSYIIKMEIDGKPVSIPFQGQNVDEIGINQLASEAKWEQQLGIVPQHIGENQKVELLLYKNSSTEPYLNLYLLINVQ